MKKRLLNVVAAFGCADPELADDGSTWLKRSGDTATVGCHGDDDVMTSTLTCVAGRWVGETTELCSAISGRHGSIPTA